MTQKAQLERAGHRPHSAVHITSTADISVVAFNHRPNTGDGAVITPTDQLGVSYVVCTPSRGPLDKLLAVVNGNIRNKVTFLPATNFRAKSLGRWKRGKEVTIDLKPYETYLIRSRQTMTGMQIKSQKPVAVFSGHQCLSLYSRCDHVYKQLPPVSQLGEEYLVPTTMHKLAKSWAVIVATEDNTQVTLYKGKGTQKRLGCYDYVIIFAR